MVIVSYLFVLVIGAVLGMCVALSPNSNVFVRGEGSGTLIVEYKEKIYRLVEMKS